MLSSRPVQLTTDAPYVMTKTPGRALSHRAENSHTGALPVNLKGKNANGIPRTPFQPASTVHRKVVKDQKLGLTTTATRPLGDKTPLPNRIGAILFQTPLPQRQNAKLSKLAFVDLEGLNQTESAKQGGKTPDSVQRPSSARKHLKHVMLPADSQSALQDTITEDDDDFDEIEYMAPNTLDLPYQVPLDFELPDYKVLGKKLWHLAHSCPYDDSPSLPELDIVVSDIAAPTWDMLELPPLSLEDDPFYQARAELAQAPSKTSDPISKTRVVTKAGPQPSSLTRQPTNPISKKTTRNTSQPQRTLPMATSSGHETVASMGTASKVMKSVPPTLNINAKGITTSGPAKPTSAYHKSAASFSSRPAGVTTRIPTSTIRRPHTVLDTNRKPNKPVGVPEALMLVKDLHVEDVVVGEDFLFDV